MNSSDRPTHNTGHAVAVSSNASQPSAAKRVEAEKQAAENRLVKSVFVGFLIASLLLAASLFATSADARVIVKERTKFYTVKGRTGRDIYRSIGLRSKRGSGIQHAIATTTSSISVKNVKTAVRRSRCVVVSADVRLKLTYRYPRWKARGASKKVRSAWANFYKHALKHEKVHGNISKKYAKRMHTALLRTTGRVSRQCSDFARNAQRKFSRLSKRLDREQKRFDRREARSFSRNIRLQRALYVAR